MRQVIDGALYTEDHLWVLIEDNLATIGVTDHGQHLLGDIALADLPEDDIDIVCGDQLANLQGRDDDLDFASPLSGRVVEVNLELSDSPELVNQDPYGTGWLVRIEMTDEDEIDRLLLPERYEEFLASEAE